MRVTPHQTLVMDEQRALEPAPVVNANEESQPSQHLSSSPHCKETEEEQEKEEQDTKQEPQCPTQTRPPQTATKHLSTNPESETIQPESLTDDEIEYRSLSPSNVNTGSIQVDEPNNETSTDKPPLNDVLPVHSKWKQFLPSIILFIATVLVVSATITLSFLSSSAHPWTIFKTPETTIAALNIGSTISVFLIGELLAGSCDNLRWTLSMRPKGVGMASFLVLGRATGLYGVISLLFSNQRVGHRKWCVQRYISV